MKYFTLGLFAAMSFCLTPVAAQIAVRNEPRHRIALENEYYRLLDVLIPPGDTTLFHIHATPSLILQFTNNQISSQAKDSAWVNEQSVEGNTWYRSFSPNPLVHRVSNRDIYPFHVYDIEILSAYQPNTKRKPLPFTLLLDNEKAFTYRITDASIITQTISGRGPLIAALVRGDEIIFHEKKGGKSTMIAPGKYLYIAPGTTFNFSSKSKEKLDLVLFELK